jgi:hypothetical protein
MYWPVHGAISPAYAPHSAETFLRMFAPLNETKLAARVVTDLNLKKSGNRDLQYGD